MSARNLNVLQGAALLLVLTALMVPFYLFLFVLQDGGPEDLVSRSLEAGNPDPGPVAATHEPIDEPFSSRVAEPPTPKSGSYALSRGRRLVFDVEAAVRTELSVPQENSSQPCGVELGLQGRGKMILDILGREEDRMLGRLHFPDFSLAPVGPMQPSETESMAGTARQMGEKFMLLLGVDGRTLGYRFPEDMGAEARQWVRTLVSAFRFVIPEDGEKRKSWETVEPDTTGKARLIYRWEGAADEQGKRKLSREKLSYLAESLQGMEVEVNGQGEATWNARLGWIESALVLEELRMDAKDMGIKTRYTLEGRLQLANSSGLGPDTIPGEDWKGPWASACGNEEMDLAPEFEADRRRKELEGATLSQLLSELEDRIAAFGLESKEVYLAVNRLAWLMRLEPKLAFELEQILIAGGLTGEGAQLALAAMGQARTGEAQQVLAGIMADSGRDADLRTRALHSAFQIDVPDAQLQDSVLSVFGEGTPRPVEGTAMLLLGNFADGREALSKEQTETLLEQLLSLEESAKAKGMVDVWLESLGNAGAPAAFSRITPYLNDSNPGIRAAAVSALRNIQTEEASAVLAKAAIQDANPEVRGAAAELLGARASLEATEALCKIVMHDKDFQVRWEALRALGSGNHGGEMAGEALNWCAAHDPSSELRILASEILSGAGI